LWAGVENEDRQIGTGFYRPFEPEASEYPSGPGADYNYVVQLLAVRVLDDLNYLSGGGAQIFAEGFELGSHGLSLEGPEPWSLNQASRHPLAPPFGPSKKGFSAIWAKLHRDSFSTSGQSFSNGAEAVVLSSLGGRDLTMLTEEHCCVSTRRRTRGKPEESQ
jgi:hypothetical protein